MSGQKFVMGQNHRPISKDSQRYDSLEIKYKCFSKSYKTERFAEFLTNFMLVSQDKLKIWLEVARLGFFNFTLYIAHQLNIFGIFIWEELFSD